MRNTTWNTAKLEQVLKDTGSYTKTAQHFGVSRQRVHAIAQVLLGPERCKELVSGTHHRYEQCVECNAPFDEDNPHRGKGRCGRCHRRHAYNARKSRLKEVDAQQAQSAWEDLKYALYGR